MTLMLATWFFASTAAAEPELPALDAVKAPLPCSSTASIESMQSEVNGLLVKIPASISRLHEVAVKTEDTYVRARLYTAAMVALSQSLNLQGQVLGTADTCHGEGYASQAKDIAKLERSVLESMGTHLEEWSADLDAEQTREVCGLIPEDMLVVSPVSACSAASRNAKN